MTENCKIEKKTKKGRSLTRRRKVRATKRAGDETVTNISSLTGQHFKKP
jgi:hypothetical protein